MENFLDSFYFDLLFAAIPMALIILGSVFLLSRGKNHDRAAPGQIKAVFIPKAGKGKPVSLGDFEDVTVVIRQMAKDYPDGGGVLLLYNEHGELYEAMRV